MSTSRGFCLIITLGGIGAIFSQHRRASANSNMSTDPGPEGGFVSLSADGQDCRESAPPSLLALFRPM